MTPGRRPYFFGFGRSGGLAAMSVMTTSRSPTAPAAEPTIT